MNSADDDVGRCLSVHLSVTPRYSVETVIYVIKLCTVGYPHHSSFFSHQTVWQYSNGDCPNGGVECKGVKIAMFDQYHALSRK